MLICNIMKKLSYCHIVILLGGIFLFTPFLVCAKISNDPFAEQWAYKDIGVYDAWDITVGSPEVVVAVIDNGIDTFHPDLEANMWKNMDEISGNNIDDDQNGYKDDVWGWNFVDNNNDPRPNVDGINNDSGADMEVVSHGTAVAGLIGAVGNNNLDGVGLNWKAKIMNLKIVGNNGSGNGLTLATAIVYAVDNGAHVINISAVGNSGVFDIVALKQAINYAYEKGVVVVAAAGNSMQSLNNNQLYPICADEGEAVEKVLGVTAINEAHRLAIFSNTGSSCVDITAPGVHVSSTVRFSPTNGLTERYNDNWNGTSFSTSIVSGAAALVKSLQPSWGAKEIYEALLKSTHHTLNQDEEGYADLFGAGLLQVNKAIEYARERIVSRRLINDILVWHKEKVGKKYKITAQKYSLTGQLLETLTTSTNKIFLSDLRSVKGDFDKDGQDEVATLGKDGDERFLTIEDVTSGQVMGFYVFDNLGKGIKGEMFAGDFDKDGRDELFVTAPGKPLTVWSLYPVRRLAEFSVGNKKGAMVRILGE